MRAPIRPISDAPRAAPGVAGRRTPRGVSFLEVVLGVVLLGLVTGTFSMAVGSVGGSFQRQRDRLAAAEVAGRLLLIRADDEEFMPDQTKTIAYGDREFRWTVEETPVLVTLAEPARASIATGSSNNTMDLSRRMLSITARAWLAETTGGSFQYTDDVPNYTLVRVIDTLDFTTSDSAQRRLENPEDMQDYFGNVINTMNSNEGPVTGSRGAQRGRTQTPRTGAGGGNAGGRSGGRDGGRDGGRTGGRGGGG